MACSCPAWSNRALPEGCEEDMLQNEVEARVAGQHSRPTGCRALQSIQSSRCHRRIGAASAQQKPPCITRWGCLAFESHLLLHGAVFLLMCFVQVALPAAKLFPKRVLPSNPLLSPRAPVSAAWPSRTYTLTTTVIIIRNHHHHIIIITKIVIIILIIVTIIIGTI